MKFKLLGTIGMVSQDADLVPISGVQQRTTLAVLLLNVGRLVSKADLFAELKYQRSATGPDNALHAVVSRLRKSMIDTLGRDFTQRCLITRPAGYTLDVSEEDVDAAYFEQLTARARSKLDSAPDQSVALLDEALSLWEGPALQGAGDGPICSSSVLHYEECRFAAVEDRIYASIASGLASEVIGELKKLSTMYPSRERLTEMLMLSLYRTGRQAEAIEVYQRSRRRLVEEFGIEPSHSLKMHIHAILQQDPMLLT